MSSEMSIVDEIGSQLLSRILNVWSRKVNPNHMGVVWHKELPFPSKLASHWLLPLISNKISYNGKGIGVSSYRILYLIEKEIYKSLLSFAHYLVKFKNTDNKTIKLTLVECHLFARTLMHARYNIYFAIKMMCQKYLAFKKVYSVYFVTGLSLLSDRFRRNHKREGSLKAIYVVQNMAKEGDEWVVNGLTDDLYKLTQNKFTIKQSIITAEKELHNGIGLPPVFGDYKSDDDSDAEDDLILWRVNDEEFMNSDDSSDESNNESDDDSSDESNNESSDDDSSSESGSDASDSSDDDSHSSDVTME